MKNILVGVSGGIAAYKAAELVSLLGKQGYEVRCIMTKHAQEFLTPLTLQTLSGNPVTTDLFSVQTNWHVEHIALAKWADCVIVAPATANIIGKVAHGLADDFLSTCIMAAAAPVVFALAMNDQMYANPVVQRNLTILKELQYHIIAPLEGHLACGTTGKGKMESPAAIVAYLEQMQQRREPDLTGYSILVTAGPTQEAIDPVRYLTNHSSGKMGYAIAKRAQERGAVVTLVSGRTNLPPPPGVFFVPVVSARDMFEEVTSRYAAQDVVIKAAAVADYRPKQTAMQKIKKGEGDWQLELERNPDILSWLGAHKKQQLLVGFAAETEHLEQNAQQKLQKKNLDFIVANDLTKQHSGFGKDTNQVIFYDRDGNKESLPVLPKEAVADRLLDQVKALKYKQFSKK